MKICIIGGGWYGAHLAIALSNQGFEVVILEKNPDIFLGISGKFGVRLHAGPHYPRSAKTRENCWQSFLKFHEKYPNLINHHAYSIYGVGEQDANGEPSKVDFESFLQVCQEVESYQEINPAQYGYSGMIGAVDINEPSVVVGDRLRQNFRQALASAGVEIVTNCEVSEVIKQDEFFTVKVSNDQLYSFDKVINTTSYQAILPDENLPFDIEVVYQPCLALVYKDLKPKTALPFSFIVMDGWFPCLMPYDDTLEGHCISRKYIMTHGKYTIMGSFTELSDARNVLNNLSVDFINNKIKLLCEADMKRFYPDFSNQFVYQRCKGTVLAKIKTNKEFRSAVTFEHKGIIYVIPGKISNVFDVEEEVLSIINNQNLKYQNNFSFVRNGVLDSAENELTEAIDPNVRNTCELQTFRELSDDDNKFLFFGNTQNKRNKKLSKDKNKILGSNNNAISSFKIRSRL